MLIAILNYIHVFQILCKVRDSTACSYHIVIRVIKSRRMRWAEHVAHIGEMRNSYNILVGKPGAKIPLRRPSRRW